MKINFLYIQSNTLLEILKIVVPVLCVLLGALIGFGFQKYNEHLKFIKIRKYFFFSLYQLYNVIDLQIEQLNNVIKVLDTKNNDKPIFMLVTGFSLNNLKVVSNETIYRIITKVSKIFCKECEIQKFKDNSNLILGFEFIERLILEFKNDGLFIYNTLNDKLEEFKKITISIRDEIFRIKLEFNTNKDSSLINLIKELDEADKKILTEIYEKKLDLNNYYWRFNIAFKPLQNISNKYNQIKLLSLSMDAETIYTELNGSKENFSKKYSTYKKYLEEIKDQFGSILFRYKRFLNNHFRKRIEEKYE